MHAAVYTGQRELAAISGSGPDVGRRNSLCLPGHDIEEREEPLDGRRFVTRAGSLCRESLCLVRSCASQAVHASFPVGGDEHRSGDDLHTTQRYVLPGRRLHSIGECVLGEQVHLVTTAGVDQLNGAFADDSFVSAARAAPETKAHRDQPFHRGGGSPATTGRRWTKPVGGWLPVPCDRWWPGGLLEPVQAGQHSGQQHNGRYGGVVFADTRWGQRRDGDADTTELGWGND
jgi:hypothetical protein